MLDFEIDVLELIKIGKRLVGFSSMTPAAKHPSKRKRRRYPHLVQIVASKPAEAPKFIVTGRTLLGLLGVLILAISCTGSGVQVRQRTIDLLLVNTQEQVRTEDVEHSAWDRHIVERLPREKAAKVKRLAKLGDLHFAKVTAECSSNRARIVSMPIADKVLRAEFELSCGSRVLETIAEHVVWAVKGLDHLARRKPATTFFQHALDGESLRYLDEDSLTTILEGYVESTRGLSDSTHQHVIGVIRKFADGTAANLPESVVTSSMSSTQRAQSSCLNPPSTTRFSSQHTLSWLAFALGHSYARLAMRDASHLEMAETCAIAAAAYHDGLLKDRDQGPIFLMGAAFLLQILHQKAEASVYRQEDARRAYRYAEQAVAVFDEDSRQMAQAYYLLGRATVKAQSELSPDESFGNVDVADEAFLKQAQIWYEAEIDRRRSARLTRTLTDPSYEWPKEEADNFNELKRELGSVLTVRAAIHSQVSRFPHVPEAIKEAAEAAKYLENYPQEKSLALANQAFATVRSAITDSKKFDEGMALFEKALRECPPNDIFERANIMDKEALALRRHHGGVKKYAGLAKTLEYRAASLRQQFEQIHSATGFQRMRSLPFR